MEPSLFKNRPVRRGRIALMVLGSLAIHGALIGVGYAMWQPISHVEEVPTTDVDLAPQLGDPEVRELVVPMDAPTPPPDMPTPPPDQTPPPDDTPPPTEEPDMDMDKPTPPPKPKTAVKYAATPAPAGAKRGPVAQAGVVGGNPNGTKATGIPGGRNVGVGWSTPKPPYPAAARASHITGITTVSYTTDGSGSVSSVTISKSAGNAILDHFTQVYVKDNFKGPPNSSHTFTFEYRLQ